MTKFKVFAKVYCKYSTTIEAKDYTDAINKAEKLPAGVFKKEQEGGFFVTHAIDAEMEGK